MYFQMIILVFVFIKWHCYQQVYFPHILDILGDGKIKPRDFYTGPPWVLGARNEYQRVCSRLNNPAIVAWMEEFEPSKLTAEYKLQRYLFKKVNKRKNIKFERYRDSP